MNAAAPLFLFFTGVLASNNTFILHQNHEQCTTKTLSEPRAPITLDIEVSLVVNNIIGQMETGNYSFISQSVLSTYSDVIGLILSSSSNKYPILVLNIRGRMKMFPNRTSETSTFWKSYDTALSNGWTPPFRDCNFLYRMWLHAYVMKTNEIGIAIFIPMKINQCDDQVGGYLGWTHQCDRQTTICEPQFEYGERRGGYRCICRKGYYFPGANFSWKGFSGEDIESRLIASYSCKMCSKECDSCESGGVCEAKRNIHLRTVILSIQLAFMGLTIIVALVVFRQRKCKTIASGMWTVLETALLGIFLLYSTVVVHFFDPSIVECIAEPWTRELGFIVCYGAIVLKMYRHLIEFRTRKAHRWVIKDTDLLKYLFIMVLSVLAYMSAFTSISLNFVQESYDLLHVQTTTHGASYYACKPLWWDYVTEIGELAILLFGVHLSIASRNAKTPFNERTYLCLAIIIELIGSLLFYVFRITIMPNLHPDTILIVYFIRSHLTTSVTLVLVFAPKFWYQQKQARSLAQEYSCRIPVDAFKDVNAHGPLATNNSDVDVGEVTLADMSPDDIRAELKRLYMQLEIFKNKTICRDNPHISKRRGGKKAQHRRFSLQNLYGKHRSKHVEQELTEAEPSRTPEDSVCSTEGPSGIYNDLPSTHTVDHRQ
ncbi:metabotropic glycine receptor isoform X2 [Onthophagus taurus]|uniref:metabotropic glycine receptor isoform X2 n=1 Tax=Onthophagus taurus TaxID=166361 RepID=UPI0039BE5505